MKYLIINADDFGMSPLFNTVILDLIKQKKISSTTVMVNRVTDEQKDQLHELFTYHDQISIGLHLEFDTEHYEHQIKEQYEKFKLLFGRNPTHVDIHKRSHVGNAVAFVSSFCMENGLTSRHHGTHFDAITTTYDEVFSGTKAQSIEDIFHWLRTLQDGKVYEILFHPGKYDPNCLSSLNRDREKDTEHIMQLHTFFDELQIKMVTYKELS